MADVFISFKTSDADRVRLFNYGFRNRGLTVFWALADPNRVTDSEWAELLELDERQTSSKTHRDN